VIGIMVDEEASLHLFFNGVDQGVAAKDVPGSCYGVVDLYGKCDKVRSQTSNELSKCERKTNNVNLPVLQY
jgi:hypothetical protein